MTHETSTTASRESSVTTLELAYALAPIGAVLLAVVVLMYGLLSMGQNPDAKLWVTAGLVAYLAGWQWGLSLAR